MNRKLTPQTLAHRLMTFAADSAILKYLNEQKIDYDLPNEHGSTLLMTAVAFDRIELIELIVSKTKNILAATHDNTNNVLHFAAISQHPSMMKILLTVCNSKLMPLINSTNTQGDTPLMVACSSKQKDNVMTLLEQGVDIEKCNYNGTTALMHAACVDEENDTTQDISNVIVQLLLKYGLSDSCLNQVNSLGQSALHLAVQGRNTNVIFALLKAGINIGIRNTFGFTALEVAEAAPYYDANALAALQEAWDKLESQKEEQLDSIIDDIPIATQTQTKKKSKKTSKKQSKNSIQPNTLITQKITQPIEPESIAEVPKSISITPEVISIEEPVQNLTIEPSKVPSTKSPLTSEADECTQCTILQDILYKEYPLFEDMELNVSNYLLHDLEHLSMSQLEILQEAHMRAY
ncbi:hypothetical protein THRCLA_02644 [Thraustotheca clavata]|uniref:Uncharacterized protein n=1 Tax=Thraustotheca clavata TaxID=74557 RepID=A0A1W0A4G4_9STRA|nr:hypothetical protein THRCLA_02644 [Thraustotheca clavata]